MLFEMFPDDTEAGWGIEEHMLIATRLDLRDLGNCAKMPAEPTTAQTNRINKIAIPVTRMAMNPVVSSG